jgi:class 3 adenylate cyclase
VPDPWRWVRSDGAVTCWLVSYLVALSTRDSRTETPRRRRGLSLTTRLAATVLVVGFVSMVAATLVGLNAGNQQGRVAFEDALDSLGSSGSYEAAAQLRFYERLAEQLATSAQAAEAIEGFTAALDDLSSLSAADVRPQFDRLVVAYDERYLQPLRDAGAPVVLRDVVSEDPAAVYLQEAYALSDAPVSSPVLLDDAADGSEWTSVHARFHPAYRNAVREANLVDIYLVDAASERIVYSAAKGPDLGTSLAVGPYRGSVVGRAADAVANSPDPVVTDLAFYNGAPGVPIGAAAAAVVESGRTIGAVVLTYDGAVYTDRLTTVTEASAGPDDEGSDLFMIGADGTTRSDPQSYLADPNGFLDASQEAGVLLDGERAVIDANATTVLVQPAADSTINAALDGDTDVGERMSMTGGEVVSVVERLPADDVEWYVVSEIDSGAADAAIAVFRGILVVGAAVFVTALAFIAVAWSKRVMLPVRTISDRLGRASLARASVSELEPVGIPDPSPVEFHRLADSFSAMGASLRRQQLDLQRARADRLDMMKRMLPASVAQRIARGDVDELDEVPSATVVVVVVLGLGALVHEDSGAEDRRLLDDLTGELDDIAFEHGLDRIKVVGDSYFAACGHDRPYIDHAPRSVSFSQQVVQAVRAASLAWPAQLDTAIAVNTGPVTVGMSGGTRLVYDVWGPTVTTAHDLARAAGAGEIVVTSATRARLPDDFELTEWRADALSGDDRLWTLVTDVHGADATSDTEAVR